MNKEKFTRAGFEPVTSGLTCRRFLAVSLFCQYLCSGAPVRSHETIYIMYYPLARDHAKVMIQPNKYQPIDEFQIHPVRALPH